MLVKKLRQEYSKQTSISSPLTVIVVGGLGDDERLASSVDLSGLGAQCR